MKRSLKTGSGQFTLALQQGSVPPLDQARKEELIRTLADLLLEALGAEWGEDQREKEENDESKDYV